ncbi:MAG: hypothetical protein Q9173_007171, partial [Seirophora scorigena]
MSSMGQEPSPATGPTRPAPPKLVCPFCSQHFSRKEYLRGHLQRRLKGGTCARVTARAAAKQCEVCLNFYTARGLSYHVNKRFETGVCPRKMGRRVTMGSAVDEEGKNGELGSKEVNPDIVETRPGGLTFDTGTAEGLRPGEVSDSLQARTLFETPTDSGTQQNLPSITTEAQYQQKTFTPSRQQEKCPAAKKSPNTCLYPHCFASFSTRAQMLQHVSDHGEGHSIIRGIAKDGTTRERCPEGCNIRLTKVKALAFEAHLENKHAWCVICSIRHVSMARLVEHYRDVHRSPSPFCPHEGCGVRFERYEEMLEHYWCHGSHPKVVLKRGTHWKCPFCGEARTFRTREGGLMHFQALHGPAQMTEESTEVRMADEETQSSMETIVGTGTYSSMETGAGGGTSSSMDTYPEASTYSSMEMMSIDSILNHDAQTGTVPASKAEKLQAQIDGIRAKWG